MSMSLLIDGRRVDLLTDPPGFAVLLDRAAASAEYDAERLPPGADDLHRAILSAAKRCRDAARIVRQRFRHGPTPTAVRACLPHLNRAQRALTLARSGWDMAHGDCLGSA